MRLIPPSEADAPYTISGLNRTIAEIIAGDNAIVWVVGEISSLKRHSSGHCYLTLIDSGSQIPAVLWKSYAHELPRDIREGDLVQVIASVKVYERGGYYQLDIRKIMRSGEGDKQLKLEQLKQKLFDEGLFDESCKRPIPERVNRVAVITAETGAAFYDICNVMSRNAPQIDLVLVNAKVQGDDAPATLVKALDQINRYGNVDLIIFGRGGGSAEDLFCFNDESVCRAVAGSKIPVISAVGHEIDVSLCDFAADLRAATPSAAAEIVVSTHIGDKGRIDELQRRFVMLASARIAEPFRRYRRAKRPYLFQQVINRVVDSRITVDSAQTEMVRRFTNKLSTVRQQISSSAGMLNSLSPLTVLSKGYAVVTNGRGRQVGSIDDLELFEDLSIRFKDGYVKANVIGKEAL